MLKKIAILIVVAVFTAGLAVSFAVPAFATKDFNSSKSNTSTALVNQHVGDILLRYGAGGAEINQVTDALAEGVSEDDLRTLLAEVGVSEAGTEEVLAELDRTGATVNTEVKSGALDSIPAGKTSVSDGAGEGDGVQAGREDTISDIARSNAISVQGISVGGSLCGEDNDCNDGDEDAFPSHDGESQLQVRISGDEVRGMSEEVKAEVRARLQQISEINNANDFGLQVASMALENENIVDIVTDDQITKVHYDRTIYILRFIPKQVEVVVRVEGGVVEGYEYDIDYPWYGFLSRKGDESALMNLATRIRDMHNAARVAIGEEGVEEAVQNR